MQAIILAAGMGKRLGELTKGNTKCMVEVGGETLIARLLRQLDKQHLSKIVLVIGYKAQELKNYLATIQIQTPIEFVENIVYDQTNNIYSLYLAKDYLVAEDTLLFESDLIMEDAVITKLLQHPYPDLAVVDKYESWMDGTVVTIDEENRIQRFIPGSQFKYVATGISSLVIPIPLSVTFIFFIPPSINSTVIIVLFASIAFSTSSLTTLTGLSTTSPADIKLIISSGNCLIIGLIIYHPLY